MRTIGGLSLLLMCFASLVGSGQARSIAQFQHRRFTADDGAPAAIVSMAQSRDGYIWLGTPQGLVRFDGLSFEAIASPLSNPGIPAGPLLATRSGDLWVGRSALGRIEIFRGGHVFDAKLPNADLGVSFIREGPDGAIWVGVGGFQKPLRRLQHGKWEEIGPNWGLPNGIVYDFLTGRDGTIWVTTGDAVAILRRGAHHFEITPAHVMPGAGLAEDPNGGIWVSDKGGTRQLPAFQRDATTAIDRKTYPSPGGRSTRMTFDREGALWAVSEAKGVLRIAGLFAPERQGAIPERVAPLIEPYDVGTGLTSTQANAVLRDRENNIWVATEGGLDRFEATNIVTDEVIPKATPDGYGLMGDTHGNVYIADSDTLYFIRPNGRPEVKLKSISPEVFCPARDGAIWLIANGVMIRLLDGKVVGRVPVNGGAGAYSCGEAAGGRLWVAMYKTGKLQWHDGTGWHAYALPVGLAGRPIEIVIDGRGRPVVRMERKSIFRIEEKGATVWPIAKLGVAGMINVYARPSGLLVLGPGGLARIGASGISRISVADYPWLQGLRDVDQSDSGTTWILNNDGVGRIDTRDLDAAFRRPGRPIPYVLLDRQDGFVSRPQSSQGDQLAHGSDGRLWLLTRQAVQRLDPAQVWHNPLSPPVVIQDVVADGTKFAASRAISLPKGISGLSIDFAVPSFVAPRRVHVRYRLEGFDDHWIEAGMRRQATYTNLKPGSFRFEVIAANEAGVWNRQGASVAIHIPPTFVQTRAFLALCVLAVIFTSWLLYSFRLRVVAGRIRVRMSDLLQERERIARELHDTLLQGVFVLFLHFQSITNDISNEVDRDKSERVLDRAQEVIAEGRERVAQLRAAETGDLKELILAVVNKVGFSSDIDVEVTVTGTPRPVNPWISDEVAQIAAEALFNVVRHAKAGKVSISIGFGPRTVTIAVRDDGVGIDPALLRRGRHNHFGIVGMRERARRIRGELQIRADNGTVVELSVPNHVAYPRRHAPNRLWAWWDGAFSRFRFQG